MVTDRPDRDTSLHTPLLRLAQLKTLCQELHKQLETHEENRYDLEFKIRKQDYDVSLHPLSFHRPLFLSPLDQRIDHQIQRYQRQIR